MATPATAPSPVHQTRPHAGPGRDQPGRWWLLPGIRDRAFQGRPRPSGRAIPTSPTLDPGRPRPRPGQPALEGSCTTHSELRSLDSATQGGALRADPGLVDGSPLGIFGGRCGGEGGGKNLPQSATFWDPVVSLVVEAHEKALDRTHPLQRAWSGNGRCATSDGRALARPGQARRPGPDADELASRPRTLVKRWSQPRKRQSGTP